MKVFFFEKKLLFFFRFFLLHLQKQINMKISCFLRCAFLSTILDLLLAKCFNKIYLIFHFESSWLRFLGIGGFFAINLVCMKERNFTKYLKKDFHEESGIWTWLQDEIQVFARFFNVKSLFQSKHVKNSTIKVLFGTKFSKIYHFFQFSTENRH